MASGITNADSLTNEEKIAQKRKLKNRKRHNRRKARNQVQKETNITSIEADTSDSVAPLLKESTWVQGTVHVVATECEKSNIGSAVPSKSSESQLVARAPILLVDKNPACLEKDAHYVCWFDTSDGTFCYRKVSLY